MSQVNDSAASSIVIVGSGISVPDHLTLQGIRALTDAAEIWTNASEALYGAIAQVTGKTPESLWPFYRPDRPRRSNYVDVTAHLHERARAVGQVAYLTQGHPLVLDSVASNLLRARDSSGIAVSVIPGISSIDTILADIGYEPARGLQIFDATTFVRLDATVNASAGLLLLQPGVFGSDRARTTADAPAPDLSGLMDALGRFYPRGHPVLLIRSATATMPKQEFRTEIGELGRVPASALSASTLWVPPVQDARPTGAGAALPAASRRRRRLPREKDGRPVITSMPWGTTRANFSMRSPRHVGSLSKDAHCSVPTGKAGYM